VEWFRVVPCDNAVANPLVVCLVDLETHEDDLLVGRPVEGWGGTSTFRSRDRGDDGDPDDVLQNDVHGLPIFSARLRAALDASGITGIQYLPVRVLQSDGTPVEGFSIANVTNLVPALDMLRSDYVVFGDERPDRRGEIKGIRRAVLRAPALAGYDILRLNEFDLAICVSERFRDAFVAGRFTGYSFDPVDLSDD
jgi:hypothetical protein